jgi:hypothetical protein
MRSSQSIAICAQTLEPLDSLLLTEGYLFDSIPGAALRANLITPTDRDSPSCAASKFCCRANTIIRAQIKQFGAIGDQPPLDMLVVESTKALDDVGTTKEPAVLTHILQSVLGIGADLALAFPALLLAQKQSPQRLRKL